MSAISILLMIIIIYFGFCLLFHWFENGKLIQSSYQVKMLFYETPTEIELVKPHPYCGYVKYWWIPFWIKVYSCTQEYMAVYWIQSKRPKQKTTPKGTPKSKVLHIV